MKNEIEIPEGCEAKIVGNKVVFVPKESENERIRKEIVVYLNNRVATAEETELLYFKRWIAYLEKQKDEAQRQFNLGVQAGKEEAMYEIEKEQKPSTPEDIAAAYQIGLAEGRKEQKPAEWNDDEMIRNRIIGYLKLDIEEHPEREERINEMLAYLERQEEYIEDIRQYAYNKGLVDAEQKPAEWSKEDEMRLKEALEVLNESIKHLPMGYGYTKDVMLVTDWLTSLPKRFNLIPKQEWSEEDEEHINSILERLEGMCKKGATFTPTRFAVSEDEDWLKSLRHQPKQKSHLGKKDQWCYNAACAAVRDSDAYSGEVKQFILGFLQRCEAQLHWKPSEEQLEALKLIVSNKAHYAPVLHEIALDTLYSDLKKLL